ncbi:MAG: hypothetical protein ACKPKO_30295, partial [Candidatus Fonsibacter sp.]
LVDRATILLVMGSARNQLVPMTIIIIRKWSRPRRCWDKMLVTGGSILDISLAVNVARGAGAKERAQGKGKRENKGKSAGAKSDNSLGQDSRTWCLDHMKVECFKGDTSPNHTS